ncbi:hypothetical protein BZA05DRAFT_398648 [Tricharina praecox]|uniref:uncharacterized protein n=1 Tax=Tricharina praecox TaxID=43433 RepID=UPI002220AE4C|nr:uncharacterized protein BZA05DRAFT_398648 [Tricharina praecox]KAI5852008.1 hypothetical protein BZA05DRAFT_398648 [Tricharina praecox]
MCAAAFACTIPSLLLFQHVGPVPPLLRIVRITEPHRRYRRDKRAAPFWSSLKPWRLLSRSRVLASNERAEQRTCEVMRTSCGLPCRRKPGWCAFDGKAGGVAFSSFVYVYINNKFINVTPLIINQ